MTGLNTPLLVVTHRAVADEAVQTIDSAELHEFLGVTTEHGKWIARRIASYSFIENADFVCSAEVASKGQGRGGHNRAVYHLTLDMAKQLSMVERTEKGKQAREYFIECERRAKAAAQQVHALPAELDARLTRLEQQLGAQSSKLVAFDYLASLPGAVCMREAAKLLKVKPRALVVWLSENGWIFRAHDWSCWSAYSRRIEEGFLIHVMVPITRTDGRTELKPLVKVTPKGLTRLAELLAAERMQAVPQTPAHSSPY